MSVWVGRGIESVISQSQRPQQSLTIFAHSPEFTTKKHHLTLSGGQRFYGRKDGAVQPSETDRSLSNMLSARWVICCLQQSAVAIQRLPLYTDIAFQALSLYIDDALQRFVLNCDSCNHHLWDSEDHLTATVHSDFSELIGLLVLICSQWIWQESTTDGIYWFSSVAAKNGWISDVNNYCPIPSNTAWLRRRF